MAKGNVAANSPIERTSLASLDQKLAMAKRCSHGNAYLSMGVKDSVSFLFDLSGNKLEHAWGLPTWHRI